MTVGVFADFADGKETVFVVDTEQRAEGDGCADLFLIDFTTVAGEFGEEIREGHFGKVCKEGFRGEKQGSAFFGGQGFNGFEHIGIFKGETTCFGTDEGRHCATATEFFSDVCTECADISSFGTENTHLVIRAVTFDIELMDGDGTGFAFDGDAASCEVDEFFAADFECAVHRGDLHDFTHEGFCRFDDRLSFGDVFAFRKDIACDVFGIGRDAEVETGYVFLIFFGQKFGCLDGSADEDGKQSRCDRIECSRVTDLSGSVKTAHTCDNVKGCDSVRFMY